MVLNAPITRDEMETHVWFDGSGGVVVDTSIPKTIRKLKKNGWEIVSEDTYQGKVVAASFKAPEKYVSFRRVGGGITEETRQALADRMRNLRKEEVSE